MRSSATESLILLLLVILLLSQTTTSVFGSHNSIAGHESTGRLISSPPRKARFHHRVSFHAPLSTPSREFFAGIHGGGVPADKLYGDDKRIVHTGPNPLHN
ncbi:hypothetical protein M0R45_022444 [Rubus argutus]|uniref:Uncharacterized protein n=1 Tax=Rubus argutus TaxID=59490 RepID=A0AAW1XHU6_RUBAR